MTMPTITRTWTGSVVLTFPYAAELVDALKDEIPVHARAYDPVERTWTVSAAYAQIAGRLMFETFPDVEIVEQARPGSSDRVPHAGDDPWIILHLRPSAPPELVTAAHRVLARLHHPDIGGDTATMQRINALAKTSVSITNDLEMEARLAALEEAAGLNQMTGQLRRVK